MQQFAVASSSAGQIARISLVDGSRKMNFYMSRAAGFNFGKHIFSSKMVGIVDVFFLVSFLFFKYMSTWLWTG